MFDVSTTIVRVQTTWCEGHESAAHSGQVYYLWAAVKVSRSHSQIRAMSLPPRCLSRDQVQPFTDRQIDLVTDFAVQTTIALESTRREWQYV
jgi:hypothetical protein